MFHRQVAPNLELRQFIPADADPVFAIADRNRAILREWLPWVDPMRSPDEVLQFIDSATEQWNAGLGPNLTIRLDGQIVGGMGSHRFDLEHRNCSIGYWLDAAHQGKGIVTRCSASLIDYLFDEAKMHRVEIRCGTGNHRSSAIPERLGFTREGVLREAQWVNDRWIDLVVWGMLEQNWKRGQS
jgi:ribosomal-protein-serine acetyltransferase